MSGTDEALPAPPESMAVHVDHDGVDWRRQPRFSMTSVAAGAVALGTSLGALLLGAIGAPLGFALGAGLAFAARKALRGEILVIRPDRVWIGEAADRVEIRFDDLREVRVSVPADRSSCLVLVTREADQVVGLGAADAELRWFAAAIEQARAHHARRKQVDGHELFFHRQEPEALSRAKQQKTVRQPE